MKTVLAWFVEAAERAPSAVMFRDLQTTLTYGDAALQVAAAVESFARARLHRGDRVVCYTDETIPLAMAFLAAGMSGVIPAALSPAFSAEFLKAMCEQCGARAVYTTPSLLPEVTALGLPTFCYAGDLATREARREAGGPPPAGVQPVFEPLAGPHDDASRALRDRARPVRLEDAFLIQPTSGSTGTPKLVLRNHAALSRYARFVGDELAAAVPADRPFKLLAITAMTHAFACHMFTTAVRFGAEFVVPAKLDVAASLDDVRALDPEVIALTPRVLRSLMRQQGREAAGGRLFGAGARVLLSAGARGDADAFHRLRREGVEIIEFYGSSEASVVAVTPHGRWRAGCSGVPVADVELKRTRSGELLVRSPGLLLDYYGDRELTELVIDDDGYYRTGDLAELDDAGYLRVHGRRRDVFNTPEGSNIYPERIEIKLESLHWVEQAFLVGDGQPYVTAHLVLRPGAVAPQLGVVAADHTAPIDAKEHAPLYELAGDAISALNHELELIEQIVAFTLYARAFSTDAYRPVTAGKVVRDRRAFVERYRSSVEQLYSNELEHGSLMLVPPRERRYPLRFERRLQGDGSAETNELALRRAKQG